MLTREHLYIMMAKCHEVRNRITLLNFPDQDRNVLRDELVSYADAIYSISEVEAVSPRKNLHAYNAHHLTGLMTFLEESYYVTTNHEIEYVVKKIASSWNIDLNHNVLLFCQGNFAVRHYDINLFRLLNTIYHFPLTKTPRIVFIPKSNHGDLLFTPILFHEVGHMVEHDANLGGQVYTSLIDYLRNRSRSTLLKNYFYLDFEAQEKSEARMRSYIKEYIADIFGSQYIGKHILHHLNCTSTLNRDNNSNTHPSYKSRKRMVESFMSYITNPAHVTTDIFLQMIIDAFHNMPDIPDLTSFQTALNIGNLQMGNPITLNNQNDLTSVFTAAWDAALAGVNRMETLRGVTRGSISRVDYYESINNAVRQSIANYEAIHG